MSFDQTPYQHCALLVLNVQQGYFDPEPASCEQVISNINLLTHAAHCARLPVIFLQHHTPDRGEMMKGSKAWELYNKIQVGEQDYILDKVTPDAFLRTALNSTLAGLDVTHLIFAGYSSEFSIDTSVRRAAALGYHVTIAADAHTSHDKTHATGEAISQHHNLTLSALSGFGVPIQALDSEQVCKRYLTLSC